MKKFAVVVYYETISGNASDASYKVEAPSIEEAREMCIARAKRDSRRNVFRIERVNATELAVA